MDAELHAMQVVSEALAELDENARVRVLFWASARFGGTSNIGSALMSNLGGELAPGGANGGSEAFANFADLYYAADPAENSEKALVACYWLSQQTNGDPFPSQNVNALLKDLGFQIPNITDALSQAMKEKPALVVQTRKSGNSRQARKLYKLTDAGQRRVRAMLKESENV
jgi:hypothetical protein